MTTWLDYARRGRNSFWLYLIAIPLALLITIVLGVVLGLALTLSGVASQSELAAVNDPSRPTPFFLGVFVIFGLLLFGFIAAVRLLHRKRFADLLGRWRWSAFWLGAGVWTLAQVAGTAADLAIAPHALKISASAATLGLALIAAPALAMQTFTEEYVFRGYVTQGLSLILRRPLVTSIVSGAIFASAHIPNGAPQAVGALMFGSVVAYAAIRTGGLALGCGAHLANNLFGSLVVVSDADVFKGAPALVTEHAPGLLWWDVGVEAVLLAIAMLLLARLPLGQDNFGAEAEAAAGVFQ
ncbi:MAG TPA: type II CAAX endopeptidase family protein [Caulobacteraceae bacterium]|jgi:membrane protease YdiL (CAAX protease family)